MSSAEKSVVEYVVPVAGAFRVAKAAVLAWDDRPLVMDVRS